MTITRALSAVEPGDLDVVDVVDDATRREFLAMVAATGVFVACGGEDNRPPAMAGGTRAVEHVYGTTEVPVDVARIVVVDPSPTTSILVALGVVPVAAASYELTGARPFGEELYPDLDDTEVLGLADRDVSLEAVAAQRPDLIIGQANFVEDTTYGTLSEIAPTVVYRWSPTDTVASLEYLGRLLGREQEAGEHLAEVDRRIAAGREETGDIGTVSLVSIYADRSLAFYGDTSWPGQMVTRLGGHVEPSLDDLDGEIDDGYRVFASAEQLGLATGEHLVLVQADSAEEAVAAQATRNQPLFANLFAARAGQVLVVDRLQALTGNPRGELAVLDALVDHFTTNR